MKKLLLLAVPFFFFATLTAQNVGVGTNNPTEKLEVTGNIKFTGDNLATATMSRITPLYIRGTGLNNNANRVLRIGSAEVYNVGSPRGLTLTILNKSNHAVVSSTNYDTYGDPAASNNLATALNGLNNTQIGVLTSFDAWEGQITQNLRDAFKRLGLYKALHTAGAGRKPYAAIFEGASSSAVPSASAVEIEHSENSNEPYAEIRGWLLDGSYVATLQVPSGLSTPGGGYAVGISEGGSVQINNLLGADTRFVTVDANGNLVAGSSTGAGVMTGSGTTNYVPKWTPSGAILGNSQIYDNGSGIGIATTAVNNRLQFLSDGNTQAFQFNTSGYVGANQWGTRFYKADVGGGIPLKFETQFTDAWHSSMDVDHGQDNAHPSLKTYSNTQLAVNGGNVGIGNVAPADKLDVSGNIKATGLVYWGNGLVRTESRADAGLRGDAGARSGFYETDAPTPAANWPVGASSWWHLIDSRHSNNGNNFAMQFAGSFYDQNLYFRKTVNDPAQAWSRILTTNDHGNYIQNQTSVNQPAGFRINGVGNINNGSPGSNAHMAAGSLTIGGTNANYGGGTVWNANTSGLMLEALDNTEISVHDSGERVASLMYYQGGGTNHLSIGRDMGWGGIGRTNFIGNNYAMFGPNSSWGAYLQVGGNGRVTTEAMVAATNGNLHLDAKDGGFATYINYYSQNNTFINAQAGNVGIGNTAPGQKLHVSGHTQVNGNLYVSTNNTTGEGIFLADDGSIVDNNDGYASMRFSLGVTVNAGLNDNTRRIILRNDGNIQMVNATAPTINFNDSDENDYYIHNNGDRLYFLYGDGYNGWGGNRPLTLYQGNKVGVNADSPSKRLQVNGDNLVSLMLQQQGNHSYGLIAGLETFNNGANTQDGPRIGFHKHGAKTWAAGIEAAGSNGFSVWEDGYDNGWGTQRFVISPGNARATFYKGRTSGNWDNADLVLERTGALGYYPSISLHNPGQTACQWFGSYSPERLNAGNCCSTTGWVPVGVSDVHYMSDVTMKKNIEDLTVEDYFTSLSEIRNIHSIRYHYLNEIQTEPEPYSGDVKREKLHLGFTAQSLPELVTVDDLTRSPATNEYGYVKGYSMGGMDGLLVAGVKALDLTQQQQATDIIALEKKIESQQQTIEELLHMLKEQKALIEKLSVK